MIKAFKNIFAKYRQSTALGLVASLTRKDVSRDNIEESDLQQFYSSLQRFRDAPDFSTIKSICSLINQTTDNTSDLLNGVIVETREHKALEAVVDNVISTLNIPIQLFHGTTNLDFILRSGLKKHVESGQLILTPLNLDVLSAPLYNALFLSLEFWNGVIGKNKILVFQTDAILCKKSDFEVSDFIDFDYIGSAWNRSRPVGMIANGGNGGLSIRDWSKTVEVLNRFPAINWPAGEDGYFAFHIELIGAKVANLQQSRKFGTQIEFVENSFGGHKVSDLSAKDLQKFLTYCPEAKVTL